MTGSKHKRNVVIDVFLEPLLKEIFDLKRNIKIIFSGSSQLEIKANTREHLVGRARMFIINRLSFNEYLNFSSPITRREALYDILLFGSYPSVAKETKPIDKKLRIKDIFQLYVQKDLVDFLNLKDIDTYNKLLVRVAMQSGDLLNVHSLSRSLGTGRHIIEGYLNILEYTFLCKRIYPFFSNNIKEISKTPKLYLLDTGIRNFILSNFNDLNLRQDKGALFENFYFSEMLANDFYSMKKINFWRTTNKTEIDFIIQDDDGLHAVEVKWQDTKTPKSFNSIKTLYPGIKTRVVTSADFTD